MGGDIIVGHERISSTSAAHAALTGGLHGYMTKNELRVVQKLLGAGVAPDGLKTDGVKTNILVLWLSDIDPQTVENTVAGLVSGDGPVEKCGKKKYRLTSIDDGKEFVQRELPLLYWGSP